MIFVYIFTIFFVALAIFLGWHMRSYDNTSVQTTRLHSSKKWFSINLVAATEETGYFMHRTTRPLMRMILHEGLRLYLRLANHIRTWLRRHVKRLFEYYSEEHDRLYHKRPSNFLLEVRAHKDKIKDDEQNNVTEI